MFSKNAVAACRRLFSSEGSLARTALYDFHLENGAKMAPFIGYEMPILYKDQSIASSHLHTRKNASLFDVSHMLQTEIRGKDCIAYLEPLCTADLKSLPKDSSVLTVFTNEKGCILDDLIVTKIDEDHLYVVSNAGRKHEDQKLLLEALEVHRKKNPRTNTKLQFFESSHRSLLALQGPKAAAALQRVTNVDLSKMFFMQSVTASVCGVDLCRITRCGYTGEDGFEISIPSIKAVDISNELLKDEDVKLAGLGARDSLRLEAGLCLYGSDISEQTTPVEAGLTWLIAKARREKGDFPGTEVILSQIASGSMVKRVGLVSSGGPPARSGSIVFDEHGKKVLGSVTSGCPAPSLEKNVAMAYVPIEFSKVGTELNLQVRDKLYKAVITKMPFVKSKYYALPK